MQFLPVLEDLDCHCFFGLVVYTFKDDSESSSTELFHDFISVINLIFGLIDIVSLIVVEPKVVNATDFLLLWILVLACQFAFVVPSNALVLGIQVDIVNDIEVHDLFLLVLTQHLSIVSHYVFWWHWKL